MRLAFDGVGHAFLGRTVVEDVHLVLSEGELVALVGPSGCGKTTLLQIAAGLVAPLKGRVERHYSRHTMVFQEPRLLPWLTARDNIAYGLTNRGMARPERRRLADEHAALVGLEASDLDKYPAELSGGMRQRVAVARAFVVHPEVVFFDEPFTAVDVGLRRVLQDLVVRMAVDQAFSGMFVTHDLGEAVRVADRVAMLSAHRRGIVDIRSIPGRPGERSDRTIFDIVDGWSREPIFAELFDGKGRGSP